MFFKCKLIEWWAFFQVIETGEFFYKASQIAEETLFMNYDDGQSPRNKDSKIQKLVAFRCSMLTSAKAKANKKKNFKMATDPLGFTRPFLCNENVFQKSSRLFIRRSHVLSSDGFNEKRNEVASKITREQN